MGRYDNRKTGINTSDQYENVFEDRDVKQIKQYRTPKLKYPSREEIENLTLIKYYWASADTYYKVANKFYGNQSYWWIIAQFNKKPFEGDLLVGDVLFIPKPLSRVLSLVE
jgi:thiamine biosynthesis lipoprotein ApbE